MIFLPIIIVLVYAVLFAPPPKRRYRKNKSFATILLEGQKRTERRNNPHAPRGSSSGSRKYKKNGIKIK